MRTRYLLEYIANIELRETVHAATCKREEFNHFLQWVFFYNNGIIQENLRHEQSRIIKYNHLVASLIILYNVNAMTRAIKRVRREGVEVRAEHLAELSPYRTGPVGTGFTQRSKFRCSGNSTVFHAEMEPTTH